MKKFMTLILVLALVMSLSAPVLAYQAGDNPKTDVTFTYTVAEPKYTVEIPAKIELVLDQWLELPVTVSGGATETLNGRKIVITLEDAITGDVKSFFPDGEPGQSSNYDDLLVVKNDSVPAGYYRTLRYVVGGDIEQVDDHNNGYGYYTTYLARGWKFFEFTEDGTKNLHFEMSGPGTGWYDSEGNPVLFKLNMVYPNSEYYGKIVFGIKIM